SVVAVITRASTESLGLREGMGAYALIKASSVILMCVEPGDVGVKLSARNQLAGKVAEIKDGAVNAEVVVELPGGERVAAIITRESLTTLGLQAGAPVVALFKASSVIVGV
ncbi:MAG: TOBE domain-containing protein, partial [Janthinobacterium lividum]